MCRRSSSSRPHGRYHVVVSIASSTAHSSPSRRTTPITLRLSRRLREGTREAHVRAESRFALDSRLLDRAAYRDLLLLLRSYYRPLEATLVKVDGWELLEPAIDPGRYRRAGLIDEDLKRLPEAAALAPHDEDHPRLPELPSLARALGCLYVLGGSALGGRIVAAEARRRLPGCVPVAFLSSRGHSLGEDWRTLQAALDRFGAHSGRAAVHETMGGALETFDTFGSWLERHPRGS